MSSVKDKIIGKVEEIKCQLIADYPVPKNETVPDQFLFEIDDYLESIMEYVDSLDFEEDC